MRTLTVILVLAAVSFSQGIIMPGDCDMSFSRIYENDVYVPVEEPATSTDETGHYGVPTDFYISDEDVEKLEGLSSAMRAEAMADKICSNLGIGAKKISHPRKVVKMAKKLTGLGREIFLSQYSSSSDLGELYRSCKRM